MNCRCGELHLDGAGTGSFNWDPDCPAHGLGSEWYLTVGKARFAEQNERLKALYALRDQRRRGEITAEEARERVKGIVGGA